MEDKIKELVSLCTDKQLIAFSLYYNCNDWDMSLSLQDISNILGVNRKTVQTSVEAVVNKLSMPMFQEIKEGLQND
jgi:predicted DNA-binding protein YlxM (UPF0122 family)